MTFSFDKAHLTLLAIVLAVAGLASYLIIDRVAQKAHDQAVIAQIQLDSAKKANSDLAAIVAQQASILAEQRKELDAHDALLQDAIKNRTVVLNQQQKTDSTLPPSELSKRWAGLIEQPEAAIANSNGSFVVAPEAGLRTVQTLESVPVLTQDIDDLNKTIADRNTVIAGLDQTVALQKQEITSDANVLKAQIAADQTELKAVKTAARRSKIKVFIAGYVAGFLTRTLIK
jgi:hypothetical protein